MDKRCIEERFETRGLTADSITALRRSFETDEAPELLVPDLSLLPAVGDGQHAGNKSEREQNRTI